MSPESVASQTEVTGDQGKPDQKVTSKNDDARKTASETALLDRISSLESQIEEYKRNQVGDDVTKLKGLVDHKDQKIKELQRHETDARKYRELLNKEVQVLSEGLDPAILAILAPNPIEKQLEFLRSYKKPSDDPLKKILDSQQKQNPPVPDSGVGDSRYQAYLVEKQKLESEGRLNVVTHRALMDKLGLTYKP